MNKDLERLLLAAGRILKCKIHVVHRAEWESKLRSGGKPTKLHAPLNPFLSVSRCADVEVYAMSAQPFAQKGGFHIVRYDAQDAPDIFNTDSYFEVDLKSLPAWPRILSAAGLQMTTKLEKMIAEHVFLKGPEKRPDHHSSDMPHDIRKAKPK